MEDIRLNVPLLRKRVPNLTTAAKEAGIRPATVSNLCTGKIDLGKAEVKTLVGLAKLANCTVDELILRGEKMKMIETGIKALDFFAPVVKNGSTGIVARPGMGQLVIVAELLHRYKEQGLATVFLVPAGSPAELEGIAELASWVADTIEEAIDKLKEIGKEAIFVTDKSYVDSGALFEIQEQLGHDSMTTLLVDLSGEVVDDDFPFGPLETVWQLDADLAARHQYPALSPLHSTSSLLEDAQLDERHFQLRQRTQKVLRRYRELRPLVQMRGLDKISDADLATYRKGERLEAYFTQAFYTAEEFTGQKGQKVSLEQTLADVESLLNDQSDGRSVEELRYIGTLS
ncbi:ATP synthase subunit beta [Planococcus massiliensis]|uniref:ATP synthase subunit beta n=1 Tax=Planococcus massiliensis TaxID=1499687 RepID=A0A098EQP5_9BACL|nr:ATP synthase subunit B [Planococcus massiliensis]CEG24105.1 ATP synthase subunit beta [Planococcus massiliensis]